MVYKTTCTRGIIQLSSSIIWVKYRGEYIVYVRGYMWGWQGTRVFQPILCESELMGMAISTSADIANAS